MHVAKPHNHIPFIIASVFVCVGCLVKTTMYRAGIRDWDISFYLLRLCLHKFPIMTTLGQQFVVRTLFNNAPFIDNSNLISVSNSAQAVGNNYRGHPNFFQKVVKGILEDALRLAVEGRRCFIKQQNLRLLYKNAGNGDALFPAARELRTVIADFAKGPANRLYVQRREVVYFFTIPTA
jgi:hypothetical protein